MKLRALVNVHDDNDFVLLVAWLLNALCNKGQHPLLVLSGAEGTAKSTLVGILRALIDPNSTELSGLPRTERELATKASQGYLQAFDNVSALSRQMSDALCRCSTGGRAHPIILNGIDDLVTRPDLADRCLFVTCDAIPDDRRRSEIQLWAEFENAHAEIFGLLLDSMPSPTVSAYCPKLSSTGSREWPTSRFGQRRAKAPSGRREHS